MTASIESSSSSPVCPLPFPLLLLRLGTSFNSCPASSGEFVPERSLSSESRVMSSSRVDAPMGRTVRREDREELVGAPVYRGCVGEGVVEMERTTGLDVFLNEEGGKNDSWFAGILRIVATFAAGLVGGNVSVISPASCEDVDVAG